MKNTYLFIITILILSLYSCSDEFVDESRPFDVLNPEIFPENMAQVDYFLNAPYTNTHSQELFAFMGLGRFFYNFDHTCDLAWLGTSVWNELAVLQVNAANGYSAGPWISLYRGVQQSRTFIDLIVPKYKEKKGSEISAADELALKYKLGEAHYLRAWHYYHLINLYAQEVVTTGDAGNKDGVIIFGSDVKIGDRQAEMLPRQNVKDSWDYVVDDLKKSMELLTDATNNTKKTWTGVDKGRIDYFAAATLLGKVLMYQEKWLEARDLFLDVVNNSGKSLMSFNNYYQMWNGNPAYSANETNNTEAIHQITFVRSGINAMDAGGSVSSAASLLFTPFYDNDKVGGATPGYGNIWMHDRNIGRFGFAQNYFPELINFPGPTRTVSLAYVDSCLKMKQLKRYQVDPDPRLWVSAYQPWVDKIMNGSAEKAILPYGNGCENDYQMNAVQPANLKKHGWSLRKFNLYDVQASQNPRMHGADMYFSRLAEVYLDLAECYWKISSSNTDPNALEYINKVHRRAWNRPVNTIQSDIDYKAISSTSPITKANPKPNTGDVSFTDALSLNALYYEMWAETFAECKWWYNVRRWKLGSNEAKVYQKTRAGELSWAADDHQYALPIPQTERDNNSRCSQNIGY